MATWATASDILNGKIAYNSAGTKVTGNIASKEADEHYFTQADHDIISAGVYLTGNQVLKGIDLAFDGASAVKKGFAYKIGDTGSAARLRSGTGTFTGNPSSGQTLATANKIVSGYAAYANASLVTGTLSSSLLNPYPVSQGYTTSTSTSSASMTVTAAPSSGTGSSASWTTGIVWQSNGTGKFKLAYTGVDAGNIYDSWSFSHSKSGSTITVTLTGSAINHNFTITV